MTRPRRRLALLVVAACCILGGTLAAEPAPAPLVPTVPNLPMLPLHPSLPLLPMLPMLPMPPTGFFSALPMMSLAGRGRGGGMGPFGGGGSAYATSNGPMPLGMMSGEPDEKAFKKAAYLSGLTSNVQYRGTRNGMSLKRYYASQPTAMPGLIVPLGAMRAMHIAK